MTAITRREFLKLGCLAAGGAAAACCGLGVAVAQTTPAASTEPIDTPDYTFGKDKTMQKRILVAYATRAGATVGVAEKIGETLGERGYSVDVKPVNDNPDPAAYDAVVIGSAVNGARWRPEAVSFVENHQSVLKQKPVAMFCVHILNRGEDAGARKNRLGYLDAVRKLVTPVSEGFFLGKGMDASNTSPLLMWVMNLTKFVPEGDCRDWGKISAWASGLSL